MAKKKDYYPKEPGQQFEEIEAEQRRRRQARREQERLGKDDEGPSPIDDIEKSRQRDKQELRKLADQILTEPQESNLPEAPNDQAQLNDSSDAPDR